MIWSEEAIDYDAGFELIKTESGTIQRPRKIGCWVLTVQECDEILRRRKNES